MKLQNFYCDEWIFGQAKDHEIYDSFNNNLVAISNTGYIPYEEIFSYARLVGSHNLRELTFPERGRMLKQLAIYLNKKKSKYYELSFQTGTTYNDAWFDIDGGIGVLFSFSSLRKSLPNEKFLLQGNKIPLDKEGDFIGHHILVPKHGTAVHINAFNFPVWGMLEKIAANLLAGVPAIIKPSTQTSQLTNLVFRDIINSGILPKGSLQLICGKASNILDYIEHQDVVTFTGSALTGMNLKIHPKIINNSVHFNLESDSLNCSILGEDANPNSPEFDIFVNEVIKEITIKCGQKCTAIRRVIVPENFVEPLISSLRNKLSSLVIGDPRLEKIDIGALASHDQVLEVNKNVAILSQSAELCIDGEKLMTIKGKEKGSYFYPKVFLQKKYDKHDLVNKIEAFGPVTTIIPYKDLDQAIEISKKAKGSLCSSIVTNNSVIAEKFALEASAYHGRILILNRNSQKGNTGHGVAMPLLNHGGPGRAGGGQELGGMNSLKMYMQLCALQGTPNVLTQITKQHQEGAEEKIESVHIFKKYFEELNVGETVKTESYTITDNDIDNFANVTGDYFYAHMDKTQLEDTLFEDRVAHGYYVLSRATGLYVEPTKGPLLLNYGLEECRFLKPVYSNMTIRAILTVKEKNDISPEITDNIPRGIVKFSLKVLDENNEIILRATTIAMVKKK